MDKRVRLLQELIRTDEEVLKPRVNVDSFCGYYYPQAQEIFECKPGEEFEQLDYLAESGFLARRLSDKVHLCPHCSHYALNFREICPRCESPNIEVAEMIHHYRCGHIAPEKEYRDGVRYLCPKCHKELRHIGVDYERPSSNYLCGDCGHLFTDPKVSCLSLTCGRVFPVDRSVLRPIYTYFLTAKATIAAERGQIEGLGDAGTFIDADFGLYTAGFFEEQLEQEIRRHRRYKRDLAMMILSPDHLDEYEAAHGREATAAVVKSVALVIRESLRDCDIPALYGEMEMIVLLPDTPLKGATIAAERIRQRVQELNDTDQHIRLSLSIGLSSLSPGSQTAEEMIGSAQQQLQESQQSGGNCIRPKV